MSSVSNVSGSARSAEVQDDTSVPPEETPVEGAPDAIDFVETPPPVLESDPWNPPWAGVDMGNGTVPVTGGGVGGPAAPTVNPQQGVAGAEPGVKRPAPAIATGLEKVNGPDRKLADEVNKILSQSPHLRELWAKAQANGWKVEFVKEGKSEANPNPPPTVRINLSDVSTQGPGRAEGIAALMAHEMGHAGTPFPPALQGRNENEYVQKNTEQVLRHEGEAALANLIARDEIRAAGGPDIGVRGGLDEFYDNVYERLKQGPPEGLSRDEAVSLLAEFMGAEPEAWDGTNKREYWEGQFREKWRQSQDPGFFPGQ